MKKSFFAVAFASAAVAMIATGCTSVEANKVGDQVHVVMPVYVKPDIETSNNLISGEATLHSILGGLITWGVDSQAVGVDYRNSDPSSSKDGIFGQYRAMLVGDESIARNGAAYDATTKANADIILTPRYVTKSESFWIFYKRVNCKVKGFPGYIKSVKVVDKL